MSQASSGKSFPQPLDAVANNASTHPFVIVSNDVPHVCKGHVTAVLESIGAGNG